MIACKLCEQFHHSIGGACGKRLSQQALCVSFIRTANAFLKSRDRRRTHTQFIEAKRNQKGYGGCIASKFATQNQFYLPNSIFYQTITGGWAEDPEVVGYTEPDMVLKPDYETTTAAPCAPRCRQ